MNLNKFEVTKIFLRAPAIKRLGDSVVPHCHYQLQTESLEEGIMIQLQVIKSVAFWGAPMALPSSRWGPLPLRPHIILPIFVCLGPCLVYFPSPLPVVFFSSHSQLSPRYCGEPSRDLTTPQYQCKLRLSEALTLSNTASHTALYLAKSTSRASAIPNSLLCLQHSF